MLKIVSSLMFAVFLSAALPVGATGAVALRVSVMPTSTIAPLYIAKKFGFFADEGLDVEFAPTAGGAIGIPGLVGKSYDVAFSNNVSALAAVAQGIDVQLVSPTPGGGTVDSALIARRADGVKSGKDLEGKIVAVNTNRNVIWLYVREWIRQTGGDPAKVTFREVPFPQMIDALKQKQIDAAFEVNVFVIAASHDPALEIVSKPYAEVQPGVQSSQYLVMRSFIEANRDTMDRFLRAMRRGGEWYDAHLESDELFELVAEFTKVPKVVLKELKFLPMEEKIDAGELEKTMILMRKEGLLAKDIDVRPMIYAPKTQ